MGLRQTANQEESSSKISSIVAAVSELYDDRDPTS